MTNKPPDYTEPATFTVAETFERNEQKTKHIHIGGEEKLTIEIDDQTYDRVTVTINDDVSPKGFWTAIHYLREYDVPGVWKERVKTNNTSYRLGALYCIGPFELTDRETNYKEYGERPYDA